MCNINHIPKFVNNDLGDTPWDNSPSLGQKKRPQNRCGINNVTQKIHKQTVEIWYTKGYKLGFVYSLSRKGESHGSIHRNFRTSLYLYLSCNFCCKHREFQKERYPFKILFWHDSLAVCWHCKRHSVLRFFQLTASRNKNIAFGSFCQSVGLHF